MAIISGTSANETHTGTAGENNTFLLQTGGTGDNNGLDQYVGRELHDRILGGWSQDVLHVTNNLTNLVSIEEIDGGDTTPGRNTILATTGNDILDFSSYTIKNFVIDGGAGKDTITGTSGNDQIRGGAGNDTLNGGDGDDTFHLVTGNTGPIPGDYNGIDQYDGGTGANRIVGGWTYDVLRVTNNLANLANIQELDGGDTTLGRNVILAQSGVHDTLDFSDFTIKNFDIDGLDGNDKITGSADDNRIIGNTGSDTLDGRDGSDTYLVGVGHGADTFNDTGVGDHDRIVATATNVKIGVLAIAGIEEISSGGKTGVDVVGSASAHQTLDFSNVAFTGIGVVDSLFGNDTIHTSNLTAGQGYRGGSGNDTFHLGDVAAVLRVSSADSGFDNFRGNNGATHRIVAENANAAIGIGKDYGGADSVDIIDGNGKANVTVVGSDSSHDVWDLSGTQLVDIKEVLTGFGNDTIHTSNDSDAAGGQAYRGGKGHDTFHLGTQDTRLLVSADDNGGFDNFRDNGGAALHSLIAEGAGAAIGIGREYGGSKSVNSIDGGAATATIVGSSSSHDVWDLSGTELTGITKIDVGAGNDKVQTALHTDGNAITYDGGAGNGDKLTISLTAAQAGNATLLAQIAALTPGAGLNGTLNAAGLQLTAQNWESFAVAVEVGGSFQLLNILFGTSNHDAGVGNWPPALIVPVAQADESWAIFGLGGDDKITGGDEADFIDGGGGSDQLNGGGGDDTFVVANSTPANGFDHFNGGDGYDTIVSGDGSNIRINTIAEIEEIDGNGFAGVRVVGNNAAHVTLNLSNATLTDISEVYAGTANNTIHTSNHTADQAYRGGKGNDTFHFGDEDTILLASSADNGGNDGFNGNTAGAEHVIVAEDDGTQIGIGQFYGGADSVDAITADGHANVTILGSSAAHNVWDFSGTDLIGIARIDTLGGDDTITVSSSMDPASQIILDGGANTDTLVLRLTNAEYTTAQAAIDALVASDGGAVNAGAFNFAAVNFENVTLDFV